MNNTSSVIAEASLRQVEYLEYHQGLPQDMIQPYPMIFETEINDPDIPAIEKSISFFVKRHESVRTIFPLIEGKIKQMVLPYDDQRFGMEFIDTNTFHESYEWIRDEYIRRAGVLFADKQKGPLVKFILFKQGFGKHKFFFLIDHIICDGWSIERIIKTELIMFYQCYAAGSTPDIQPLKMQLRDYCDEQKTWLYEKREALSNFWKDKISGYDNLFKISNYYDGYFLRNNNIFLKRGIIEKVETQKELAEIYDCPRAVLYQVTISGKRFNRIKKSAQTNRYTISSIVYASLYILLYCYADKRKVLLAALVADRFISANQFIIGYLLGSAYFSSNISDHLLIRDFIHQTLNDTLTSCQNIIINHDYLYLDGAKLRVSCDMLTNYIRYNYNLSEITEMLEKHSDTPGIYYPLEYTVFEYDDGFVFYWKYNKLLFDKELIEDMVECHKNILDYIAENEVRTIGDVKNYLETKTL